MSQFTHEHLDAWHVTLKLTKRVRQLVDPLPPKHRSLADQLKQTAQSVCLNIAKKTNH